MTVIKHLIALTSLLILLACSPPASEGVGHWGGRNHSITAEVAPGTGLSDVVYIVTIDGQTVIRQPIPRSEQSVDMGVQFSATGTYNGASVRAVHEQKATLGQLYFQDKIYINGELVAVISP